MDGNIGFDVRGDVRIAVHHERDNRCKHGLEIPEAHVQIPLLKLLEEVLRGFTIGVLQRSQTLRALVVVVHIFDRSEQQH